MHILHIIDSGGLYGAEIMLLHLMEAQVKLGLKPILASIGAFNCGDKPIEIECRKRKLQVEIFRMRAGLNWYGAFDILKFARRQGVQLLHSHGYKGNILFGLLPRGLRQFPLISTAHGWTSTGEWNRMRVYEWFDGLSLRFVDTIVLVNSAMKSHPRVAKLRDGKVAVIPNGIPSNQVKPDSTMLHASVLQFAKKGFSIVAVGRLSIEKGYTYLIQAVAELVKEGYNIRLAILGQGQLQGELEQQVKALNLSDYIFFSGYIENARNYLEYFDLLCMPSLTEGLPIVLLEAMDAGVPIIASQVGGIPEAINNGNAGLLVPPGDTSALKAAIINVIKHPDTAEQRSRLAVSKVRNIYSSEQMAKSYLATYQALVK